MSLDPSFVGRSYSSPVVYEVGREKIREFADALGDPEPVYRDPAAARALGYPDVIAPPTFVIVMTMSAEVAMMQDPELGLDFSRVVHGEQRFEYTRPIHAGDRLKVTVSVESIRAAAGNDVVGTRADVETDDGQPVCSAYSVLVARGTAA